MQAVQQGNSPEQESGARDSQVQISFTGIVKSRQGKWRSHRAVKPGSEKSTETNQGHDPTEGESGDN